MPFSCTACSLHKTTCVSTPWNGKADIMVIGDRCTSVDVKADAVPSGKIKSELVSILMQTKLPADRIYYTTTVRGVVPAGKTVGKVQIAKCWKNLKADIDAMKPKVIILLGACAYKNFHIKAAPGTIYFDDSLGCTIIYTHHLLKYTISGNQQDYADVLAAFTRAKEIADGQNVSGLAKPTVNVISSVEGLIAAMPVFTPGSIWGMDGETSGLIVQKSDIVTIGLANDEHRYGIIVKPEMIPYIKTIFENIKHIGHNIKFDMQFLRKLGTPVKNPYFDTLLAHYAIRPGDKTHDLASVCLKELGTNFNKELDYVAVFERGITDEDRLLFAERGALDAYLSFKLYQKYLPIIEKSFKSYYFDTLVPVACALAEMEFNGIDVDENALFEADTELSYSLKAKEQDILQDPEVQAFMIVKGMTTLNLASPKQLSDLIYGHLKFPVSPEAGKSTSKDVLEELNKTENDPLINKLLEYRNIFKLKNTYIESLKKSLASSGDGRIHPSYHQTVTVTGRLSCSNPNLQTIPKSVKNAGSIRKMFIARERYTLVEMDYKQLEFRVWAHLSRDPVMIDMIARGGDIHQRMASQIFHVELDKVTPEQRQQAKEISFGLIYGMGVKSLSARTGVSIDEARQIKDNFFAEFPQATLWLQQVIDFGLKHKYVVTPFGRRIPIEYNPSDEESVASAKRHATNYPVQSTAGELTNLTSVYLIQAIKDAGLDASLRLNVHDALISEVRDDQVEKYKEVAQNAILAVSDRLKFRAYLLASFHKGKSLGEQEDF